MEKRKRKICFIITMIGVLVILICDTTISIMDEKEEKKENFIKVNVVNSAKECVLDKKCNSDKITFLDLIDKKYLDGYFLIEIEDYSTSSYVDIPSYEVNLIKRQKN